MGSIAYADHQDQITPTNRKGASCEAPDPITPTGEKVVMKDSIVKTEPGSKPKGAKALNAYHAALANQVEHYATMEAVYRRKRKEAAKDLADSLRACL